MVAAFNEYICEHTVSMGRFLMDRYAYYDITGDGKPDLCTSVTHGSGIISTGIFVYDIENGQGYQLQDRGEYDYWVDSVKDGAVYIKKGFSGRRYMNDGAVGKLEFVDGVAECRWYLVSVFYKIQAITYILHIGIDKCRKELL